MRTPALADAYARALADVHDQYPAHAVRVTDAIEVLSEEGREAWIARGISHDFGERLGWDGLDRLELLSDFPCPGLCARSVASRRLRMTLETHNRAVSGAVRGPP